MMSLYARNIIHHGEAETRPYLKRHFVADVKACRGYSGLGTPRSGDGYASLDTFPLQNARRVVESHFGLFDGFSADARNASD